MRRRGPAPRLPEKRSVNLAFNLTTSANDVDKERKRTRELWGPAADRIEAGSLFGTPDQVAETILAYRDAGAEQLNIALRAPFNSEALDAYIEKVVPQIRAECS